MHLCAYVSSIEYMYNKLDVHPNWHELFKQEKCSSFVPPRATFYKTQ